MKNCVKVGMILTLITVFIIGAHSLTIAKDAKPANDSVKVDKVIDFTETVTMEWPKEGNWVLEDTHISSGTIMELYYPKGESSDNWTQLGTVETAVGKIERNIAGRARLQYLGTQLGSLNATWDIIKMDFDKKYGYKWVLFEIICPNFINGDGPQVQLWKIMGGKTSTFMVQYSYKGKEMPGRLKDQMIEAFLSARIERHPKTETESK